MLPTTQRSRNSEIDFRRKPRSLANSIAQAAVGLGFADPAQVDFDSTVQEANMSYPSDASLMTKLAGLGKKVVDFVGEKLSHLLPQNPGVDMKAIKSLARAYFFLPKNRSIEIKRDVFKRLHKLVKQQMRTVVQFCEALPDKQIDELPWNIIRVWSVGQKPSRTNPTWNQNRRPAETIKYQGQKKRPRFGRAPPQSPCRHRTTHRTRKTGRRPS